MQVAAIDIGTNSVLLLVADVAGGALLARHQRSMVTRLGQGVDAAGRLDDRAVERTLEALAELAADIAASDATQTAAVATSALRDAESSAEFLDRAESVLGVRPRVISGAEEAELTFTGAVLGLELPAESIGVFDIGGGSTEIITGQVAPEGTAQLDASVSLDVGCVRLTERFMAHDPPTPGELDAVRHAVRDQLRAAPALAGKPLIGVAGTITALAAVMNDVWPYDGELIHGRPLSRRAIQRAVASLGAKPLEERRRLRCLDPKRADVIVTGAVIVDELMAYANADRVLVSDRGIRWGLAKRLAGPRAPAEHRSAE